jgi:hypothetical protein
MMPTKQLWDNGIVIKIKTEVKIPTSRKMVTAIIEGDASGFFKLAEPLLARTVQRSVDSDYEKKNIIQSKGENLWEKKGTDRRLNRANRQKIFSKG